MLRLVRREREKCVVSYSQPVYEENEISQEVKEVLESSIAPCTCCIRKHVPTMYHSKFTANSEVSAGESTASNIPVPSSAEAETMQNHSTELNHRMPEPSAPLVPSSQDDSKAQDMEPPSYSSLFAQNSMDPKYHSGSFYDTNNQQCFPTTSSHLVSDRSESGLKNPPPFSVDDGAASGPLVLPLPGAIEEPGRSNDLQEVITMQPKTMNMNAVDYVALQTNPEDEDREKRQRSNTNADRRARDVESCADCCFIYSHGPILTVDSEPHHSSCCCDDGDDGCCDGDDGCCDGDGNCCDCGDGGCDCGGCDCDGCDGCDGLDCSVS